MIIIFLLSLLLFLNCKPDQTKTINSYPASEDFECMLQAFPIPKYYYNFKNIPHLKINYFTKIKPAALSNQGKCICLGFLSSHFGLNIFFNRNETNPEVFLRNRLLIDLNIKKYWNLDSVISRYKKYNDSVYFESLDSFLYFSILPVKKSMNEIERNFGKRMLGLTILSFFTENYYTLLTGFDLPENRNYKLCFELTYFIDEFIQYFQEISNPSDKRIIIVLNNLKLECKNIFARTQPPSCYGFMERDEIQRIKSDTIPAYDLSCGNTCYFFKFSPEEMVVHKLIQNKNEYTKFEYLKTDSITVFVNAETVPLLVTEKLNRIKGHFSELRNELLNQMLE